MKKLFVLALLLCSAATLSAQRRNIFGVRAGLNVSDLTIKNDGLSVSPDSRGTFHAGFSYQHRLSGRLPFYLETGLYLSDKGGKIKEEDETLKMKLLYMQVPVVVNYHFDLAAGKVSIQPYAGLYYGLGVSGKMKLSSEGYDATVDLFKASTVEGEAVPQSCKRSDVGIRAGVGVNFCKRYYAGLGYDAGLMNILKNSEEGLKMRNGVFHISVGYTF